MRALKAAVVAMGLALGLLPGGGAEASCNQNRVVAPGDTVFSLAKEVYGDHEKWTLIYHANQQALEASTFKLTPGTEIFVPCATGQDQPPLAEGAPFLRPQAEMVLVAAAGYAPFSDPDWPGQGMAREIVTAALEMMPAPVPHAIAWDEDRRRQLDPILADRQADMGFPWPRPDCAAAPGNPRCTGFHFSDPLVEVLMMLFVTAENGFEFRSDADVLGKTLCRPAGQFTDDLDRPGRDWLKNGLITLVRAESPRACFERLTRGEVDAVTVNVFLGALTIDDMGLRGRVVPLERPLSTEGLHVIIPRTHWRGTTFLYRLNAGLAALKASDRYDEIVARHLAIFRDRMKQSAG